MKSRQHPTAECPDCDMDTGDDVFVYCDNCGACTHPAEHQDGNECTLCGDVDPEPFTPYVWPASDADGCAPRATDEGGER